jgi:hypothetical protein
MEREQTPQTDIVDLGEASTTTKGAWGLYNDEVLKQHMPGLSVD